MGLYAILFVTVSVAIAGHLADAAQCCSAYTDLQGDYHPTELCADYCCIDGSVSLSAGVNIKKVCCDDPLREVPSDQRNEECLESWIKEHIWVPIVCVVVLIVLIAICTCCCCCACCRSNSRGVVVQHSGGQPQTTVVMSQQQQQQQAAINPVHYGYNQ